MAQPLPARGRRMPTSRWLLSVLPAFPDLLTIIDANGFIDYVSPSVNSLLGHGPELIIGHRACEFLPDDDVRNASGWLQHAASHEEAPQFVHRLERSDHTFGWFESSVHRMCAAQDSLVVVASRDITARRLADSHLADAALLWRGVADLLAEAVLIVDENGTIMSCNQSAAELFGLSRHALLSRDVRGVVEIEPSTAARLDQGEFTASVPQADGHGRRVHGSVRPLPVDPADSTARPAGRIAVLIRAADPGAAPARGEQEDPAAPSAAGAQLSRREIEVLRLLAEGRDVRAVSAELGISIHTTRNYVKSVLHKLDARTQLQAVVIAVRAGLVDLS